MSSGRSVMYAFILLWLTTAAFAESEALTFNCEETSLDCVEADSLQLIQTSLALKSELARSSGTKSNATQVGSWIAQAGTHQLQFLYLCQALATLVLVFAMATPPQPQGQPKAAEVASENIPVTLGHELAPAPPKKLEAINVIRLVGVIHIAFYHIGPASTGQFNDWGSSWLTFFFTLSGLGASYSKIHSSTHVSSFCPKPGTLLRRWASVYPLYLLAALVGLVALYVRGAPLNITQHLLELSMLQAFAPLPGTTLQPTSSYTPYNMPDWFCSCLVICWLLEEVLFKLARACWRHGVWVRTTAFLCTLLGTVVWHYYPEVWFTSSDSPWMMPGFAFLHCYFCGVMLAFCISDESCGKSPVTLFSASVAGALILAVFYIVRGNDIVWISNRWVDHSDCGKWIMLPLHCLLLHGLAMGRDPLARAFANGLPYASELSCGIYLLQIPIHEYWPTYSYQNIIYLNDLTRAGFIDLGHMFAFLAVVTLAAAVSHFAVQKPCSRIMNALPKLFE